MGVGVQEVEKKLWGNGVWTFSFVRPHTILQEYLVAHCWECLTRQGSRATSKEGVSRSCAPSFWSPEWGRAWRPSGPGEPWWLASTVTQRRLRGSHLCRIEEKYSSILWIRRAPGLSHANSVPTIIFISFSPLFVLLTVRASTSYSFPSKRSQEENLDIS